MSATCQVCCPSPSGFRLEGTEVKGASGNCSANSCQRVSLELGRGAPHPASLHLDLREEPLCDSDHLDRLFVTSARVGLSAAQLDTQPLAGAVFEIDAMEVVGLPGLPARV